MYIGGMARTATPISLTDEDRESLEQWTRSATTEQRFALRARIIMAAAEGQQTRTIARQLAVRNATVSKWRTRFVKHGLPGLQDELRPGAPKRYDEETEHRIIDLASQDPPPGNATWTAELLAEMLKDVSMHHVWRVLRQHDITCSGDARMATAPIPNSPPKPLTSSACISNRQRTPSYYASTKNLTSRHWNGLRACSGCPAARP